MYERNDGVIEVGSDGAFDLSATPKPASSVKVKVPKQSAEKKEEKELSEWEIKKQRGNSAYSSNNFELAVECYSSALDHIAANSDEESMKVTRVSLLANRALCHMKRAEELEALNNGFKDKASWSPDSSSINMGEDVVSLWKLCEKDCEEALAIDPGHAKTLYRNSRAKHALGNHLHAFSAARNAKRIAPKAKEIVSWEAWLRALESEREATTAATVSAQRAFNRGDGGQDASGVAEQACLEAAAAYLHVLGSTATHTNQAVHKSTKSLSESDMKDARDWRRGPRDATEGALFAATRAVALAMHSREPESQSDKAGYLAKICQDVALGASRVAGGGLSGLLAANDPRRMGRSGSVGSSEDDETTSQGAGMRAARATLTALLSPMTPADASSPTKGLVSMEAAVQAAAASAFFTVVMKGGTAGIAANIAQKCLVEGGGVELSVAKNIASNLSQGIAKTPSASTNATQEEPEMFIASEKFSGAKQGYVFRSGGQGVGYYLDRGSEMTSADDSTKQGKDTSVEDQAFASLLTALPNDEARESVKKLLKLSKSELKKLPSELQDHVSTLKDMYKQHVEFAKQSKSAEKVRDESKTPPKHNPRDGPVPPSDMSLEEKLLKRRADELKWLEEYSEKERKRREELVGKEVVDRAMWEKEEVIRKEKELKLQQEEDDNRRNTAVNHINELRDSSTLNIQQSSVRMDKNKDKKRKDKQKKEKKKERSGQFDDIRKLAASASLLSFD